MSLSDVKDRVAGTVGESSHAVVQAVVTALDVIYGKLGEQVRDVWRCEQSQMNLLRGCLWVLLPEESKYLEPELNNRDKAYQCTLMIYLNFGSDDAEGGLDEVWEVF
jgi:hypothetical protein